MLAVLLRMFGFEKGAIRYRYFAPLRADLYVITSVYSGQILQVIQTQPILNYRPQLHKASMLNVHHFWRYTAMPLLDGIQKQFFMRFCILSRLK